MLENAPLLGNVHGGFPGLARVPSRLLPLGQMSARREAKFVAYLLHSLRHIFLEICAQDSEYLKLVRKCCGGVNTTSGMDGLTHMGIDRLR